MSSAPPIDELIQVAGDEAAMSDSAVDALALLLVELVEGEDDQR